MSTIRADNCDVMKLREGAHRSMAVAKPLVIMYYVSSKLMVAKMSMVKSY
jgi:hypothetical protein